jgi:hypothetical protein
MKKSLKRTISLALTGTLLLTLIPAAAAAAGDGDTPMATIITKLGMGQGSSKEGIYDHPEYFDEGGVDAVIAAGNVYINDFAIPATGDALTETYTVNEDSSTLEKTENGWTVSGTEYSTYAEATKALISDELPGGLAIDLYDTDADGKAEVVKIWYTEGLIVNKITKNDDGSYSVFRGDLARVPTYAGRLYDAEHFSATSGEVIKAENFDTSIQEGDGAIFYKTPDGWILQRATEANGIFMEGIDTSTIRSTTSPMTTPCATPATI